MSYKTTLIKLIEGIDVDDSIKSNLIELLEAMEHEPILKDSHLGRMLEAKENEIEALKATIANWRANYENLYYKLNPKENDFFQKTFCAVLTGILGNSFIAKNYNEACRELPYEKVRDNNVGMAVEYAQEAVGQLGELNNNQVKRPHEMNKEALNNSDLKNVKAEIDALFEDDKEQARDF